MSASPNSREGESFRDARKGEYTFGCEIEIFIQPKLNDTPFTWRLLNDARYNDEVATKPDHTDRPRMNDLRGKAYENAQKHNRMALRATLAWELQRHGVKADACHGSSTSDYTTWSLMDELSLDEPKGFWRMEFVSQVHSTESIKQGKKSWVNNIVTFLQVLNEHCHVKLTRGCSMHVHVAPGLDTKFTDAELESICKAICYFDDATTRILPEDRKINPWATSNCSGYGLTEAVNQKLVKFYSMVPTLGWKALFDHYFRKGTVTESSVYKMMSNPIGTNSKGGRYVAWNFQHVSDPCGTIEFRRPPGVSTANDALHWICFTLGFISQAVREDWTDRKYRVSSKPGTVDELNDFVRAGLRAIPSLSNVNPESIGLCPLKEIKGGKKVMTAAELDEYESILEKQGEKAMRGEDSSPFASKVNSRASTPVHGSQDTGNDLDIDALTTRLEGYRG